MKIIRQPVQAAKDICGNPKVQKELKYRRTRHCMQVETEDGTLLYHTLTGEMLWFVPGEDPMDSREVLIRDLFLVPEAYDECRTADGVRQILKLVRRSGTAKTNFTILTTTDCNARCFYCYEMGTRRYAMTPETARDVGNYIVRVSEGKPVRLSWFGGEPLYNRAPIDCITEILRNNGIEYHSILTSNGYFLDAEMAETAVRDWHLTMAQITIDGTEQVYNRTKAYIHRTGESAYQRVLRNVESAMDAGIEIAIRLNMDAANAEDLFRLVDEMGQRWRERKNLHFHVILLRALGGTIHPFQTPEDAVRTQEALNRKLDELGFLVYGNLRQGISINQCMADSNSCEVILPDGRVEKCEHIDDAEVIGSIYSEERDGKKIADWKETVRFEKCSACELYPMCINLRKCPWNQSGCSETRRQDLKNRLRQLMRLQYRKYLETGETISAEHAEPNTGGSGF